MKTKLKIAQLYLKSLDGCGVQRAGKELDIWALKNGHLTKTFSFAERSFARAKGHGTIATDFLIKDISIIQQELELFDIVIIQSYPAAKNSKEGIDACFDLIKNIKKPIIAGFMHEITKQNINRIPHVLGIMNACDVIFNFTEESFFSTELAKMLPSKKLGERIKKFTMWLNFSEETENLRNNITLSNKTKELLYLGRWTSMKDPSRVLDMGPALKEIGVPGRLIGIERSIGAKSDIFDHEFCYDLTIKNKQQGNPDGVPVHGPYIRHEGMEQMAKTLFGCSFYRMPKDPLGYGNRMEYTQIEIIAVGSLPVFDMHWAENNRTKTGERYIDIPYSGIYSDKNNLAGTIDQLAEVANSPEIQQKIRDTSYEIIRNEYDAEEVLPLMFEHILSVGKDKDKFETIDDMIMHITNSSDYVAAYNKYKNEGNLVSLSLKELSTGIVSVFEGLKRTEVEKIKLPSKIKTSSVLQF